MKNILGSTILLFVLIGLSGCTSKEEEIKNITLKSEKVIKELSRSGKLIEIYKSGLKIDNGDLSKMGEYIDYISSQLIENGYPLNDMLDIATDEEAIKKSAAEFGIDRKVGLAIATYTTIIAPGMSVINTVRGFPLYYDNFAQRMIRIDKHGINKLKEDKSLYTSLMSSKYADNFDLGL